MKNNMLEVQITTEGFAAQTKLKVDVYQGIQLDAKRELRLSNCPWVLNNPKHKKDPVSKGNTLLAGSFFRTKFQSYISAPLVSNERIYVHTQDREVLISIDTTAVEVTDMVFVYDLLSDFSIEGNHVIDPRRNRQLHDVNNEGSRILMRIQTGQFLRIFTNRGTVTLGLNAQGVLDYVFGSKFLPESFLTKMWRSAKDRQDAEDAYWELFSRKREEEGQPQPHAGLFAEAEKMVALRQQPPTLVLVPDPAEVPEGTPVTGRVVTTPRVGRARTKAPKPSRTTAGASA